MMFYMQFIPESVPSLNFFRYWITERYYICALRLIQNVQCEACRIPGLMFGLVVNLFQGLQLCSKLVYLNMSRNTFEISKDDFHYWEWNHKHGNMLKLLRLENTSIQFLYTFEFCNVNRNTLEGKWNREKLLRKTFDEPEGEATYSPLATPG